MVTIYRITFFESERNVDTTWKNSSALSLQIKAQFFCDLSPMAVSPIWFLKTNGKFKLVTIKTTSDLFNILSVIPNLK